MKKEYKISKKTIETIEKIENRKLEIYEMFLLAKAIDEYKEAIEPIKFEYSDQQHFFDSYRYFADIEPNKIIRLVEMGDEK